MLFQSKPREGNPNDPYMVNPKGVKVQVPEINVKYLLKKGFILVDKGWTPTIAKKTQEDIDRDFPLPVEQLKEEVSSKLDLLPVTEI